MKYYKKVSLPIETPVGNYCCGNNRICDYLDMDAINEGGCLNCTLNFHILRKDKKGRIVKPEKCRTLKEVK